MSRDERVLERYLRHWRESGLLTPELEAQLRASARSVARGGAGAAVRAALALLGGGLLLAGLVLIVAENWEALPRAARLAGWAAVHLAVLVGAVDLGRRLERPALAEALTLVAGGWILGGIALVSQLYNLDARPANGLWLWLALLLPLALALPRRATAAAVFVAAVAALAYEVSAPDSLVRAAHADGPWLWLAIPVVAAALAGALPHPLPLVRGWTGVWTFACGQFFLLVLGAAQDLDRSDLGPAWAVAAPALLFAVLLPARVFSWDAATARLLVLGTLAPWMLLGARHDGGSVKDALAVGLSWMIQLALAALVVRAGARANARGWVNLGYAALLAGILTRYFDFFGAYLEGGLALVMTGLLLLFVLWVLERARRRTLAAEART